MEVLAISIFVFLVLCYLPPDVSILLLNGLFVVQISIDVYHTHCIPSSTHRHGYDEIELPESLRSERLKRISEVVRMIFENRIIKLIALGLQFGGIVGLAIYIGLTMNAGGDGKILRVVIAFPLVLLVMSFIWSNWVQKLIAATKNRVGGFRTARYKSCKFTCWMFQYFRVHTQASPQEEPGYGATF